MANSSKIGKNRENFVIVPKDGKNYGSKFAKGNQLGRMPKKGFTLTDLTKLVREYDKTQDVTLLEHYIQQLRKDNRLLDKYMDRYVPIKTINELTGPDGLPIGGPIVLHEKVYQDCPLKSTGQCPVKEKVKQADEMSKS